METVITGNEIFQYDPEKSQDSKQWVDVRTMFIWFFDVKSVVRKEFVPQLRIVKSMLSFKGANVLGCEVTTETGANWMDY